MATQKLLSLNVRLAGMISVFALKVNETIKKWGEK